MTRLVPVARRLRKEQTSAEEMLWKQLRNRRCEGVKFRRQMTIAGRIADFASVELSLTIELDGVHHANQIAADRLRRTEIEGCGYLELRFSNTEVVERLDWVMQEIRRAIDIGRASEARSATPRWPNLPST